MRRSPSWGPGALWAAGGGGHEPRRLAVRRQALRRGPGVPRVGPGPLGGLPPSPPGPALPGPPRRRGPVGPMPDDGLLAAIRAVLAASPFHGEGHRKVWARLRHGGVRTSRRRVPRLMREAGLLAPSRAGAPRGPRSHDGTIIPETVGTMWGTDPTT